jgi:hypothetical protein
MFFKLFVEISIEVEQTELKRMTVRQLRERHQEVFGRNRDPSKALLGSLACTCA